MENICHALCTYMILCLTLGYVTFGMPFEGYQITDPDSIESDNNEILHILDEIREADSDVELETAPSTVNDILLDMIEQQVQRDHLIQRIEDNLEAVRSIARERPYRNRVSRRSSGVHGLFDTEAVPLDLDGRHPKRHDTQFYRDSTKTSGLSDRGGWGAGYGKR